MTTTETYRFYSLSLVYLVGEKSPLPWGKNSPYPLPMEIIPLPQGKNPLTLRQMCRHLFLSVPRKLLPYI